MDDADVIRTLDLAMDEVLRRKYESCAERNAAIDKAVHELHVD